ncbi:MAG TPA: SGNH/GDSL hydrolase family protein [Planctomycetia bacterium]|nr:SGNH/GDSL hydrolase family protein [Planctomycetia bacterium]
MSLAALVCCLGLFDVPADCPLQSGDTVVFAGDSITQAGDYVTYVEAYLLTQRPDLKVRIVNAGLSSETASGTSEPDHNPPRPCIHDRFARDVAAFKPNVVVACYGMNDGNYHPFEPLRFEKYQKGIRRLVERVFAETPARKLVLLTPPPFDPYRRNASDPDAKHFGYRFPAVNYDETLTKYSEWLMTLASEKVQVSDVHGASNRFLAAMRMKKASFHLAGDAVHPGPTGHWLIAQALLRTWKLVPQPATIEWKLPKEAKLAESATWGTPPLGPAMGFDHETSPAAREFESERGDILGRTLKITGLAPGRYELHGSGETGLSGAAVKGSAGEFAKGVPVQSLFLDANDGGIEMLLELVQYRRAITANRLEKLKKASFKDLGACVAAVTEAENSPKNLERRKRIESAAKPKPRALQLLKASEAR